MHLHTASDQILVMGMAWKQGSEKLKVSKLRTTACLCTEDGLTFTDVNTVVVVTFTSYVVINN